MKKSILFLLMLFTTFCSAQHEQETKDLKAALKVVMVGRFFFRLFVFKIV